MKKIFAVLSLVVFCSVIFTGCSSSSIVGTWKAEETDRDGNKITCTMTFNEDNTGVCTETGTHTETCTWTQAEGDKYFVSIDEYDGDNDGSGEALIEIKGGEFKWKNLVFVKQ